MKFGDIVLVPFPFTDLTSTKVRPALVISQNSSKDDLILAFISSVELKANQYSIRISQDSIFFGDTGLKVNSIVRLNKIATLSRALILGKIGKIPVSFLNEHYSAFTSIFGFNTKDA